MFFSFPEPPAICIPPSRCWIRCIGGGDGHPMLGPRSTWGCHFLLERSDEVVSEAVVNGVIAAESKSMGCQLPSIDTSECIKYENWENDEVKILTFRVLTSLLVVSDEKPYNNCYQCYSTHSAHYSSNDCSCWGLVWR
jgi:hypothetical protein